MQDTSTRSPSFSVGDARTRLDDGADGLVAQDGHWIHLGDIALEDVQVGPADRKRRPIWTMTSVGVQDSRIGDCLPGSQAWPVVDESFHGCLLLRSGSSVEAGLAGNERPRPVFQPLPVAQEKLNERRVRRKLRAELGEQALFFEERALLARARLGDVDRCE